MYIGARGGGSTIKKKKKTERRCIRAKGGGRDRQVTPQKPPTYDKKLREGK